ncbi:hypothetical protein C8R45DRAFT_920287 [Mycena sanguinolenta]|nr:hypothetical protein C8R45DRAFT_920287 [Mycena sanguinolenta]
MYAAAIVNSRYTRMYAAGIMSSRYTHTYAAGIMSSRYTRTYAAGMRACGHGERPYVCGGYWEQLIHLYPVRVRWALHCEQPIHPYVCSRHLGHQEHPIHLKTIEKEQACTENELCKHSSAYTLDASTGTVYDIFDETTTGRTAQDELMVNMLNHGPGSFGGRWPSVENSLLRHPKQNEARHSIDASIWDAAAHLPRLCTARNTAGRRAWRLTERRPEDPKGIVGRVEEKGERMKAIGGGSKLRQPNGDDEFDEEEGNDGEGNKNRDESDEERRTRGRARARTTQAEGIVCDGNSKSAPRAAGGGRTASRRAFVPERARRCRTMTASERNLKASRACARKWLGETRSMQRWPLCRWACIDAVVVMHAMCGERGQCTGIECGESSSGGDPGVSVALPHPPRSSPRLLRAAICVPWPASSPSSCTTHPAHPARAFSTATIQPWTRTESSPGVLPLSDNPTTSAPPPPSWQQHGLIRARACIEERKKGGWEPEGSGGRKEEEDRDKIA